MTLSSIIEAYYSGKTIEILSVSEHENKWRKIALSSFTVDFILSKYDKGELRIKPQTITINGHEVPQPETEPPKENTEYFTPNLDLVYSGEYYTHSAWEDDEHDHGMLERGIIHLTKEAAIQHAKALLSFTTQEKHL